MDGTRTSAQTPDDVSVFSGEVLKELVDRRLLMETPVKQAQSQCWIVWTKSVGQKPGEDTATNPNMLEMESRRPPGGGWDIFLLQTNQKLDKFQFDNPKDNQCIIYDSSESCMFTADWATNKQKEGEEALAPRCPAVRSVWWCLSTFPWVKDLDVVITVETKDRD